MKRKEKIWILFLVLLFNCFPKQSLILKAKKIQFADNLYFSIDSKTYKACDHNYQRNEDEVWQELSKLKKSENLKKIKLNSFSDFSTSCIEFRYEKIDE